MITKNEINNTIAGLLFIKEKMYNGIFSDRLGCIDDAISTIEEAQEYREIGTLNEVSEAIDKANAKKCIEDSCPDHTHYKCPTCGKIQMSVYAHGCPRLGRIPHNCDNCGQRLEK